MKTAIFFILAFCALDIRPTTVRAEEPGTLLKGGVSMDAEAEARLSGEESEYDGKMAALDRVARGEDADHETKLKLIEQSDSTAKSLLTANENAQHERKKRDIERKRALEEKLHAKRVAEIMEKAGSSENPLKESVKKSPDLPLEPDIPERLMKLAAEMDRVTTDIQDNAMAAGNEFFGGMSDSVSRSAKFLAQKPGTVLPQMMDGLLTYLTQDYNENNQRMYDEAVQSVEEIQKNPARFFGEHAIDAAMSAAGAAGELAGARAASAASELGAAGKMGQLERLKKMRQKQAKKLEQAGQALEDMAEDARKFSSFDMTVSGSPDFSKIFGTRPGLTGPVNLFKGKENCFAVALAAAKRWKTGKPYIALDSNPHASMYNPATGKIGFEDIGSGYSDISKVLKKKFGEGRAKFPFHGGQKGLRSHQEGWPMESSQKQIESAMRVSKDKSQGLVFVDDGDGAAGHVFNVRNNDGNIEFWDFQPETPVQYMSFRDGHVVMKANGQTAAVPLPWKRIFFYRID